jgi:hypothetical protein
MSTGGQFSVSANNAHIIFKRPELVDSLNDVIAKHFPGALAAE